MGLLWCTEQDQFAIDDNLTVGDSVTQTQVWCPWP